jgi:hypothetical protein
VEKLLEESKPAGNVSSITSAPYISAEITSDGQRTKFFRDVYGKTNPPSFVSNITDFFTEMNSIDEPEVKTAFSDIKKIQTNITDINITGQGFSESAYLQTVGGSYGNNRKYNSTGIQVSNPENFFDAVVKATNQYNYSRQLVNSMLAYTRDYMVSKGYGSSGNQEFTQIFLKEEVVAFFSTHKDILNNLLIDAQSRVTIANEELSKNASHVETIFKEYYVFGLSKPKSSAEQFTSVNANAIRAYIFSDNYLPGDEAIMALNIQLKLGIVVFSKNNSNHISIDNNIFYNVKQTNGLNLGSWNRVLFLYKETTGDLKDKYGIMTFTYALSRNRNNSICKFTIFRKNDLQIAPPLYILYTIFYLKYLENHTVDCVFYPGIMDSFYQTFFSILDKTQNGPRYWKWFENIYTWFPTDALRDIVTAPDRNYDRGIIFGGARDYRSDYRSDYRNRNNYANSYLRRETTPDLSKICYTISIDLVLKKGSPLTPDELSESKCTQKWENIKREFAIFTNREYKITPVYDFSNNKTLKNKSKQNQNVQNQNVQNRMKKGGTRKHHEIKKIYVGKHGKTRKNQ